MNPDTQLAVIVITECRRLWPDPRPIGKPPAECSAGPDVRADGRRGHRCGDHHDVGRLIPTVAADTQPEIAAAQAVAEIIRSEPMRLQVRAGENNKFDAIAFEAPAGHECRQCLPARDVGRACLVLVAAAGASGSANAQSTPTTVSAVAMNAAATLP